MGAGSKWFFDQLVPAGSVPVLLRLSPSSADGLWLDNIWGNALTATGFLLLFDSVLAPPAADDPVFAIPLASGQSFTFNPPGPAGGGRQFLLGLWAAVSSTPDVYTPLAQNCEWWAVGRDGA